MPAALAILCYHRVLPEAAREGAGRPYFLRGTAIGEACFATHLRSIAKRLQVLGEAEVLDWLDGRRTLSHPSCWITFDDGYLDVIEFAAPALARHGFPASAFITTATLENPGQLLPADAWYAVLASAARDRGALAIEPACARAFDLAADYQRFVDGPERRRYLRATPKEQQRILAHFSEALGGAPSAPADSLYMTPGDLQQLARAGWSVGGHGRGHALLPGLPGDSLVHEVEAPLYYLRVAGLSPRVFAYPDGAVDHAVALAVAQAGWSAGLALGGRSVETSDPRTNLPRYVPADDPSWVEDSLLPSMQR